MKFGSRKLYSNLENANKTIEIVKAEDSGIFNDRRRLYKQV